MAGAIEAFLGFSRRNAEPATPDEVAVPGYPDNRIVLTSCRIDDAREAQVSFGREGFVLARHASRSVGELQKDALNHEYHEEMAEFVMHYLGASFVRPFDPNGLLVRYGNRLIGRRAHEGRSDVIDDRIPASFAHVDFYPDGATSMAKSACAAAGKDLGEFSRFAIVQTWRAVSGAPQDVPLAICDRTSVVDADISPRTGILSPENAEGWDDPSFVIGGIHYNPAQRWYFYPDMEPDEVLLFTGYDSSHADSWKVAHGAFDNHRGIPRVSVEARFYAYFK